ncbi:MAG: hypothetical protein NT151_12855 [Acidobacteria bacterium]|nr:hypothetical protein [Acidobacteriota bacterium]
MRHTTRVEGQDSHDVTCIHCGTPIADKALICYRCGRSTTEPQGPGSSSRRTTRRPLWLAALGLAVLVGAGLFMASAAAGRVPEWLRWTIAGCAVIVLVSRLARRIRR